MHGEKGFGTRDLLWRAVGGRKVICRGIRDGNFARRSRQVEFHAIRAQRLFQALRITLHGKEGMNRWNDIWLNWWIFAVEYWNSQHIFWNSRKLYYGNAKHTVNSYAKSYSSSMMISRRTHAKTARVYSLIHGKSMLGFIWWCHKMRCGACVVCMCSGVCTIHSEVRVSYQGRNASKHSHKHILKETSRINFCIPWKSILIRNNVKPNILIRQTVNTNECTFCTNWMRSVRLSAQFSGYTHKHTAKLCNICFAVAAS